MYQVILSGIIQSVSVLTLMLAVPALAFDVDSPIPYPNQAEVSADLLLPKGEGPFPAVVLMHGCSGLAPGIREGMDLHARFLTDNGFAAVILDSFSAREKNGGMVCESYSELTKARTYRQYDALNTMRYLKAHSKIDVDNIFLMGQSNGGSASLGLATGLVAGDYPEKLNYRAIVAYYPWCGALKLKIEVPLLVLGAELDEWVSPIGCVQSRDYVKGAPYNVIVYDDAYHSFDLPIPLQTYLGFKLGGNQQASDQSRIEMLAWFRSHMSNQE